jgi:DNA-binding transcriptional LysR family regulator
VAARTGSLAQAGEELRVSKTAVAKRISTLEALLDCRLLERGSHGVRLTDAGRQFLPRVEQVLAEAEGLAMGVCCVQEVKARGGQFDEGARQLSASRARRAGGH